MELGARLRAFAALVRQRSLSKAAAELRISQPAVSRHIADLEAEIGTQLVRRRRTGTALTHAGEILADYVLRAEALLANARRAVTAGSDASIGILAVAASGIPGTYLLPPLLGTYHRAYPGVETDFQLSTSGGALDLVRRHRAELAVVGGMTLPPELESRQLVEDDVVLVGPAELSGTRPSLSDLERLTWVTREEGSATRAATEAARWQIGLHAVRILELPSWESVKLAVVAGAGIAAISRYALRDGVTSGRLAILNVPGWRLNRTISAVTARDVPLTPPAARFLALLEEELPALASSARSE